MEVEESPRPRPLRPSSSSESLDSNASKGLGWKKREVGVGGTVVVVGMSANVVCSISLGLRGGGGESGEGVDNDKNIGM